jgi:hypothetical protein
MTVDEVVAMLHADPKLARDIARQLRILRPWSKRKQPSRGGCTEWERRNLISGEVEVEVYFDASWMECVGLMSRYMHVGLEECGSLAKAKAAADIHMTTHGWRLL